MKKSIIVFIFATQLGSSFLASASNYTNSNVLYTSENKGAFENYIENQNPMFFQLQTDNWKTFQSVVTKFNNSTSQLLKVSESEMKSFFIASEEVKKELSVMNSIDSKKWINTINKTEAIIKFTWEIQQPIEVEFEKVPKNTSPQVLSSNFIGE